MTIDPRDAEIIRLTQERDAAIEALARFKDAAECMEANTSGFCDEDEIIFVPAGCDSEFEITRMKWGDFRALTTPKKDRPHE